MTATDLKACCDAVYSSDALRWLVGESLHPGGLRLTRRLTEALGLGPGDLVVDLASGTGTSAIEVARVTGADVVGIDISRANVALAAQRAVDARLPSRVSFLQGDAEALPLAAASVDAVICECALCLFPDKDAAAREIARVLRPNGRLALSDVTAEPEALPAALRSAAAWTTCAAGARPLVEIAAILERAGFAVDELEDHSESLDELVAVIETRLDLASLLRTIPGSLASRLVDARELVRAARTAIAEGTLGYGAVYAALPSSARVRPKTAT